MALTIEEVNQIEAVATLLTGLLPTRVQPYAKDALVDIPLAFEDYQEVVAALAKLPPRDVRTVVSIVEAFGVPAGTPLHTAARLADNVIAQRAALVAPAPVAPGA